MFYLQRMCTQARTPILKYNQKPYSHVRLFGIHCVRENNAQGTHRKGETDRPQAKRPESIHLHSDNAHVQGDAQQVCPRAASMG